MSFHLRASAFRGLLGVFAAAIGRTLVGLVVDQNRKAGTFRRTSTRSPGLRHQWHNYRYGSGSALPPNRLHWTEGIPRHACVPLRPSQHRQIAATLLTNPTRAGRQNEGISRWSAGAESGTPRHNSPFRRWLGQLSLATGLGLRDGYVAAVVPKWAYPLSDQSRICDTIPLTWRARSYWESPMPNSLYGPVAAPVQDSPHSCVMPP